VAKGKVAGLKSKIARLESELLTCNAETLEAQKAYVELEAHLQEQFIPVIPMNINSKEIAADKFTKEKSPKDKEKATK
jgi:hypothetical protein